MYNKFVSVSLFVLTVVLIIGYGIFRFAPLFMGPHIAILTPQNMSLVTADFTDIEIETKRVSELFVNDLPIFINADGVTTHRVYLEEGISTISIKAQDIYDSFKEIEFSVIKNSGKNS